MVTKKIRYNAHKVAYLANQFPNHKLKQLVDLITLPQIDINAALWYAQELGLIKGINKDTEEVERGETPTEWDFGPEVAELETLLVYCVKQLGSDEADMEEVYMSNWTNGYPSHDVLIALKHLVNQKILATYELTDVQEDEDGQDASSTYTFFTLFKNRSKKWGKKQFKEAVEE